MIRPIEAIEGRKEILFSFSAASGSGQAQCAAPFNQGRLAPIRAINRPSAFREGAVGIEVYQGSCVPGRRELFTVYYSGAARLFLFLPVTKATAGL
jgi:hypothetical protein